MLQPWLVLVLEEGLGSSFHHVFNHLSFPLALFSHSNLGDMRVAGQFQSSLWKEGEVLAGFALGKRERKAEIGLIGV